MIILVCVAISEAAIVSQNEGDSGSCDEVTRNVFPPHAANVSRFYGSAIIKPSCVVRIAKRNMKSPACAACRVHRKKCSEECFLAPFFPSAEPDKFAIVHRVFGTSNITKMLQGVADSGRADAVNSMVSEASARLENPVHGCTSALYQLQKQIDELESQLAATQAELTNMRWQYDELVLFGATGSREAQQEVYPTDSTSQSIEALMYDDEDPLLFWEI
ncbi:hypothetical protein KI387_002846 [Taxus chinensis]|uniref:LOB domain-containing protein n=1 Tax=Taxus chinensis TaxID=29808 RepID=A0AA38LMK0_TAXCH|nr:hypothetical protein KI387_002846 [Taxus chinensis]